MLHPLLRLMAGRPQLLAEHAEAYGELLLAEGAALSRVWQRQALLAALGVCALGVAVVLAGAAALLWAVTPLAQWQQAQAPWMLWAVPLLPLAAAALCMTAVRRQTAVSAFDSLRQQLRTDLDLLRTVGSP